MSSKNYSRRLQERWQRRVRKADLKRKQRIAAAMEEVNYANLIRIEFRERGGLDDRYIWS